jgi:SprT protein
MPKEKVEFSALADYLPDGCLEAVLEYIYLHKVQLTITKARGTILGDYRHPYNGKGHRISVNGDLNKYSFFVTLLHEIAHLITFENHGRKAIAHGKEWKANFGKLLHQFIEKNILPTDVQTALTASMNNPAASSCADEKLLRVLKKYDPKKEGFCLVEELIIGETFTLKGNRIFVMGEKIRKRYKCKEVATGKWYLFSGVHEVQKLK